MCFEIKESDGPGRFFSLASARMALTKPVEKRRVGRPRKHEISGSDAEPREHILKTAARLFGFSRAEHAMCEHLMRGATLAEAADALQIAKETARSRLKSIFAKAGVARQADLLLLLAKLAQ